MKFQQLDRAKDTALHYPKYTKSELARMFGVQSASTIAAVLAGKTWKHVT